MSLATRLQEPDRARGCALGRFDLDPADRVALDAALDDPAYTADAIRRALAAEGHTVSATTIRTHRRSECNCDPR